LSTILFNQSDKISHRPTQTHADASIIHLHYAALNNLSPRPAEIKIAIASR